MRQYGGACAGCKTTATPQQLVAVERAQGAGHARTPDHVPYVMAGEVAPMCAGCRRTGAWRAVQSDPDFTPEPMRVVEVVRELQPMTYLLPMEVTPRRSAYGMPVGHRAALARVDASMLAG